MNDIIEFDAKCHYFETKEWPGLFIFFKYIKKNLYLFTAIDKRPADFEQDLKRLFEEFHERIEFSARKHYLDYNRLVRFLTQDMAENFQEMNPYDPKAKNKNFTSVVSCSDMSTFETESPDFEAADSSFLGGFSIVANYTYAKN